MTRSRGLVRFFLFGVFAFLPLFAQAGETHFRVLLDVDNDVASGCTVAGMAGVDQVFITTLITTDTAGTVTRTSRQLCSSGSLGAPIDVDTAGWPAGFQAASGNVMAESRIPFPALGGVSSSMRLGVQASQGAVLHTAIVRPDGSTIFFPGPRSGKRRSIGAPGAPRVITLDGNSDDWNALPPIIDGIASSGSPSLRILRVFAFADVHTDFLYFRFDANLSEDAPFADDDEFQRAAGAPSLAMPAPGVLQGDFDPNGLPLTATPVSSAKKGSVTLNPDGSFTYTPEDPTSTEADTFEYKATNGSVESNTARVRITVSSVASHPPVARGDSFSGDEDAPVVVSAPGVLGNDSDADGDTLTSEIRTSPAHGSVTLNGSGGFTYIPNANFFGSDSFTYAVSDGSDTAVATVTITVAPINDAPVVESASFTIDENSTNGAVVGTVSASDVEGDPITFNLAGGNTANAFSIHPTTGQITVANGTALDFETRPEFNVEVGASDGSDSSRATTRIAVRDRNDLPAVADSSVTTAEDTPLSIVLGGSDPDADALTYAIVRAPLHGTLSGTAPNLTYTPDPNYNGSDAFVYMVNDGDSDSPVATVSLSVTPVDDPPVGNVDVYATRPGVGFSISPNDGVLANDLDPDGDPLRAVIVTMPANGTIVFNEDGGFSYMPHPAFSGIDTFSYEIVTSSAAPSAVRSLAAGDAITVSINVHATNAAPVAQSQSVTTNEDTLKVITLGGSDPDNDAIQFEIATQPAHGILRGGPRVLQYVPNDNYHGADSFTFTVTDGFEVSAPATVSIAVAPVNDAPNGGVDVYGVLRNATLNVTAANGVLANDADVDGDALTAVLVDNVGNGTLTLNANGSFSYTPRSGFTGSDHFRYAARDGVLESRATRVTINVRTTNAAPTAAAQNVAAIEDTTVGVTLSGSDPDGDILGFAIATPPAHGTLTGTAPNLAYTPAANYFGTDSFTFTATDGFVTSAPATVTITTAAVNDAPVATDSEVAIAEDGSHSGSVAGLVTDVDSSTFTFSVISGVNNGTLVFNPNGTYTYTPSPNYHGGDSFSWIANDGSANSNLAMVSITVTAVDAAPVFTSSATASVPENTLSVTTVTATDEEAQTLTYSITGGADQSQFAIDAATGALTFTAGRDFEAPADSDANNIYMVQVSVSDGTNTVSQTIAVTITNVNEAPSITSANTATVPENTIAAATVSASDEEGAALVYSISGGADQARFTVDGATGVLSFASAPDFEAPADSDSNNQYVVQVTVSDGTNNATQTITVTVTNVNEAPSFTSTAVTAASEDAAYTYNVTVTDPDAAATLTINASTLPSWLSFTDNGNGTATLTGTPGNGDVGNHNVVLDVTDGSSSAQQSFTIGVANTNDAPAFTSTAVTSATEDVAYSYSITTSDIDAGDTRTITASVKPAWLTLTDNGDGTATLAGTPSNSDVGTHNVTLEVNDGDGTVQQAFTITVANVNDAPTFTSTAVTSATEEIAYSYSIATGDVDAGDTRTITAPTKPSWLTLTDNGDGTATLSGTPSNSDVGSHNVVLEVNDGDTTTQQSFTITVANVNDAPAFTSTAVTTATEDVAYSYSITTSDIDASDTRTITATAKPAWLTIADNGDGTATLSGTPTNSDVGTHNVTLEVNDGDATVQQSFTITVANVNDAPVFTSTAVTNATEDSAYSYSITTADVDAGDTRTITAPIKPAWLTLTDHGDGTATLSGTPANSDVGTNNVTLRVSDGTAVNHHAFTMAVANANDAPSFTSAAVTSATEDVAYSYSITTSDVDAGDARTITAPTKPAWLTITDNGDGTATLSGTPANGDVGTHNVTLEVNDGDVTVQQSFTIAVANVNDAPTFTSTAVTSATEDSAYSYSVTTADVDAGDTRTITAPTKPAWLTITDNGDGTATLSGTPSNSDVGSHNVVLEVNDGDTTTQQSFSVTVANANDAPTFTSTAVTSANEDSAYSYSITTSDADAGDTRTITAPTKPAWLTITDNGDGTATLSGTPSNGDVGANNVTLEVNDGDAAVQQSFTITVANVNDAPTFTSTAVTSATEDSAYSYSVTTADVDAGDTRTITAPTKPAWLTFTDNGDGTATLSGTPSNSDVGSHSVVLEVNDGDTTTQQSFSITVANANDAPTFTSTAVTSATEDSAYSYSITTSDADAGDTRTITAPTKPAWLTITDNGDGTATLSGTPANGDVGANSVVLEVNDGDATVQQSFTITVANVNDAPTFTSTAVTSATEDSAYSYSITTSDVDAGDTRTITAPTKPVWLTFTDNGDGTATLSGTPSNTDVGSHNVVLEVNDGDTTTQQSFSITVANANDAPTFTSTGVTSATEDSAYSYSITTSDVDAGDTRTITAPTKPAWLTITDNGDGTATLSGTPANGDVGANSVVLEVNDGDATAQQSFTITVANVNDAPTFTSTAVTSATEDSAYSYSVTTADVDTGDTRTITAPTKPAWLTFTDNGDGTATLSGTPSNTDVGSHNVVLEVNDGDTTTQQSFTITVANANDAPTFTSTAVTSATEDSAYSYSVTTSDVDAGDTRTITAPTKPAWLTITDNGDGTATLSGTPANGDVGANSVILEVNDGDATAQQSFTITVANVNDAPTFTSTAVTSATEDTAYSYSITTSDVDAGDTRTITAPTKPAWLTITDNGNGTATLSGTPSNTDVGSHAVVLEVNDGDTTAQQSFSITVANSNDAPSFTSTPVTTGAEDVAYSYSITTADVDAGDTRTITAPTKPAWLTITDNGNGTATLSGTPLDAHVGANSVILEVNDGEATVQQSFTITVSNTNDVPIAAADTDTAIEDGGAVTGNVLSNDTDDDIGDTLTVSQVNGSGANVGSAVAATYGSVTIGSNGAYTYTIDNSLPAVQALGASSSIPEVFNYTASDGTATDSSTLTVTVTGSNDAPVAVADTNSISEDTASATGNVLTNDTDVDTSDTKSVTHVEASATDVGAAVAGSYGSINIGSNGAYTYTLNTSLAAVQALDAGETLTETFDYTMADGGAAASSSTITTTITGVNDAPVFTSSNSASTAENTTSVTTVAANDPEGSAVTFTLTGGTGADQAKFSITSAGVLTFVSAPDFESPTDADANNSYVVEVIASDGGLTSAQTITVTVTNVNEAPVNAVPGAQSFNEDVNRVFSTGNSNQISISDPDAGTNPVQVALSATHGTLTLSGVAGLTFTAGTNGSASMTFEGTISAINTALNGLTFDPTDHYYGAAQISITTNDKGNTGSGSAESDSDNINLNIAAVNDAPVGEAKLHVTQSGLRLTIDAATHTGELKENATDVDDHDPFSELTIELVPNSATPAGSTVTLDSASDGSFKFDPRGGVSGNGSASFQYKVCDNGDVTLGLTALCSDPVTVTFNITGPETWYVDDTDSGNCGVNCTGSLVKPLVGLNNANAAFAARGTGDMIFVHSGTYNHGHTMAANESLIGQASTGSFDVLFWVSVPANGTVPARPSLSGAAVTLQNTLTAANNTLVRGLTINSGTNKGYVASGATTLTVLETSVSATGAVAGTGNMAVDVVGATNAANTVVFSSTTSGGGTRGVSLDGVNGTWSLGGGSLNGNTQAAFYLQNSNASTITYSGSLAPAASGRAVLIGTTDGSSGTNASNGLEAGTTVTLSGNITAGGVAVYESTGGTLNLTGATHTWNTGATKGVDLVDNHNGTSGATINFSGGNLNITTTSGTGFHASEGGTVNVTGTDNVINATANGIGLEFFGASGATMGGNHTWKSISANGGGIADWGMRVQHTTGNFIVTGDDNNDGNPDSLTAGGTIQNIEDRGAEFSNVSGTVSLNGMTFTNAATTNGVAVSICGLPVTGDTTQCNAAIHLVNATASTTLKSIVVSGSAQQGINANNVTNLTMTTVEVTGAGNETDESGVLLTNIKGTGSVTNGNFHDNHTRAMHIANTTGTLSAFPIKGTTFNGSTIAQGLLVELHNAGTVANVTVGGAGADACTFSDTFGNGFEAAASSNANLTFTVNGSTITNTNGVVGANAAAGGTVTSTLTNNTFVAGVNTAAGVISLASSNGGTLTADVINNVIGSTGVAGSGTACSGCNGMFINPHSSSTSDIEIRGNIIQNVNGSGIFYAAGNVGGTYNHRLTITGNVIRDPGPNATTSNTALQIRNGITSGTDGIAGTADDDAGCVAVTLGGATNYGGASTNTDAMNIFEDSWNGGSADIFLFTRFATTTKLPSYVSPFDTYVRARNVVPASPTSTVSSLHQNTSTATAGTSCP